MRFPRRARQDGTGTAAAPFLKWAGGKGQLVDELLERAPRSFGRYHEPFVGGGALFFALEGEGRLRHGARLCDANAKLVTVWVTVQTRVEELIDRLTELEKKNSEEEFYKIRAKVPKNPLDASARLLYLNRTCFNGLFRENASGGFNVPYGHYANPRIVDAENLRRVAGVLQGVEIACESFLESASHAKEGDFVYFDPPYDPVSKTSSFTAYARGGFGDNEHWALALCFQRLAERGVHVLLSNSDTPLTRELYQRPEFGFDTVQAARSINSKVERRGNVSEILVSGRPGKGARKTGGL